MIDLIPDCLLHYKMNDNAADKVVLDSSGRGMHAEAQRNTNVLTSPGKINLSLRNDPAFSDYIYVHEGVVGTVSFFVSIWVKFVDYNKAGAIIAYRESSSNLGIWTVAFTAEHKIQFFTYRGGYGINLTTNNPIPDDGEWHQIFCQRKNDGATESGYIWIDNGNTDYVYQTGRPLKSIEPFYHLFIGSNWYGNYPVSMYFDCLGLWEDKVVSQEERGFLWNGGRGTELLKGYEYKTVERGIGRGICRGID